MNNQVSVNDLAVGTRVEIDGWEFECTNKAAGISKKIRFREVNGSNTRELPRDYVKELWEEERLNITRHVEQAERYVTHLHNLNKTEQRNFERCCEGVRIYITRTGSSRKFFEKEFNEFCEKQNHEYLLKHKVNPKKPQQYETVKGWVREYQKHGNFLCFIKKDHRTHYRNASKFDEEMENLMHFFIMVEYASPRRFTMKKVHRALVAHLAAKNDTLISYAKEFTAPSYETLNRRYKASDMYTVIKQREGQQALRAKAGYGGKIEYPPFIGGRVEVDCKQLDVLVYDEKIGRTYRPWLMLMLDVYTRCVIGWELSQMAPSSAKATLTLRDAIGADSYPYRAIPIIVIFDNGCEFINESLITQCKALGIRIEYAPPRTGKAKTHIERLFGTGDIDVFHNIPGTTFSNPTDRREYDSEGEAQIFLEELKTLVRFYFEKVYSTTYHRGICNTPKNAWIEATKEPELAPTTLHLEEAKRFGTKVALVSISNGNKVRYNNLWWTSPSLPELNFSMREKAGKQQGKGETNQVQLHYNECDLTHAYVCDPRKPHELIMCDPYMPKYQTGLTMEVHEFLMAEENAKRKVLENDESALRARIVMEDYISNGWSNKNSKNARITNRKKSQLAASAAMSAGANPSQLTVSDIAIEKSKSSTQALLENLSDIIDPENDSLDQY